jgi:hypothetical protein
MIDRRRIAIASSLVLSSLGASACSPSSEPGANSAPDTVLQAPAETIWRSDVLIEWDGSDPDGEVVAFQMQLVATDSLYAASSGEEGEVLHSVEPAAESGDENWTAPDPASSVGFAGLDDGWYEFRVRAIDEAGEPDPTPSRAFFRVLLDESAPVPVILQDPPHNCGRLHGDETTHTFLITASDATTNDVPIPRAMLEHSWVFSPTSPTTCGSEPEQSADWEPFPDGAPVPVEVSIGLERGCTRDFTLRVRDPAGNVATTSCALVRPPN